MTALDIVKAMIAAINAHDVACASEYASDSLTVTSPNLPHPIGKEASFGQMQVMLAAFPDWHYDVHAFTAVGKRVTVRLTATATHTAPLEMCATTIQPTGKRVRLPDKFVFTVENDQIVTLLVDSPPGGGALLMMRQLLDSTGLVG